MDTGHITQLARDQLGTHSKCVYHQDFTRPPGEDHLMRDHLGAGDVFFIDDLPNTQHEYSPDGLHLSIERPPGTSGNKGELATARITDETFPDTSLLLASYERPSLVPSGTAPGSGVYAAMLLLQTGKLMGVSCQFKAEGVRMNLPLMFDVAVDRPYLPQSLVDRIFDQRHPSRFTVALTIKRTATPSAAGKAFLFVGNDMVDSYAFDFMATRPPKPINQIRAGVATASGGGFTASLWLLDFQIWAPTV